MNFASCLVLTEENKTSKHISHNLKSNVNLFTVLAHVHGHVYILSV